MPRQARARSVTDIFRGSHNKDAPINPLLKLGVSLQQEEARQELITNVRSKGSELLGLMKAKAQNVAAAVSVATQGTNASGSQGKLQEDEDRLVRKLVALGYSDIVARLAICQTGGVNGGGMKAALAWLQNEENKEEIDETHSAEKWLAHVNDIRENKCDTSDVNDPEAFLDSSIDLLFDTRDGNADPFFGATPARSEESDDGRGLGMGQHKGSSASRASPPRGRFSTGARERRRAAAAAAAKEEAAEKQVRAHDVPHGGWRSICPNWSKLTWDEKRQFIEQHDRAQDTDAQGDSSDSQLEEPLLAVAAAATASSSQIDSRSEDDEEDEEVNAEDDANTASDSGASCYSESEDASGSGDCSSTSSHSSDLESEESVDVEVAATTCRAELEETSKQAPDGAMSWDWPLSRQEKKQRLAMADKRMQAFDRKVLIQALIRERMAGRTSRASGASSKRASGVSSRSKASNC